MQFLAYFAVLAITVSSVLFGLDLLTAPLPPSSKPTIHAVGSAPPNPIRQIPIGRAAASKDAPSSKDIASRDGPTPVHPASPGGALKEAARQAEKPAAPPAPETNSAVANTQSQAVQPQAQPPTAATPPAVTPQLPQQVAQPAPQVPSTPQQVPPGPQQAAQTGAQMPGARPNSCNVQSCAVAYKSFRAEDCSYQPFDGPRRICENPPAQQQHEQVAVRPRERGPLTATRDRRGDELDDVAREVRQLSRRDTIDDEDDGAYRPRGVVIRDEPYDDEIVLRPTRSIGR